MDRVRNDDVVQKDDEAPVALNNQQQLHGSAASFVLQAAENFSPRCFYQLHPGTWLRQEKN